MVYAGEELREGRNEEEERAAERERALELGINAYMVGVGLLSTSSG